MSDSFWIFWSNPELLYDDSVSADFTMELSSSNTDAENNQVDDSDMSNLTPPDWFVVYSDNPNRINEDERERVLEQDVFDRMMNPYDDIGFQEEYAWQIGTYTDETLPNATSDYYYR